MFLFRLREACLVALIAPGCAPVAESAESASPSGPTSAEPETPGPPTPYDVPSCPSGHFCVDAPKEKPDPGAPEFPECATTATPPTGLEDVGPWISFDPGLTKTTRATDADACCYEWFRPCPGGRPYRETAESSPQVAPRVPRTDWASGALRLAPDAEKAAWWADQAAAEHASVAAFSRLTLQLLALGAPPELLELVQVAGMDEIRHARDLWALAAAYGRTEGPGRLPLLTIVEVSPVVLAIETLRDGCLGEGAAALMISESAACVADPSVKAILEAIAEDELNHARLSWAILRWLVDVDSEVLSALNEECERMARELPPVLAPPAAEIMPLERQQLLKRRVFEAIVRPGVGALVGEA